MSPLRQRWLRLIDPPRRCMLFCLLTLFSPLLSAKSQLHECDAKLGVGSRCTLPIHLLHPTQPGVGLLQVDEETQKLKSKSAKKLIDYAQKKRIPVVIGPDGQFWLVDRHHLTRALWDLGMREVPVEIEGRLDDADRFWEQMQQHHWAWLKDEHGRAVTPQQLPRHIALLPDYPYRSLAGFAEDAGLFRKEEQRFFIEFAWAQYLGEKLKWRPVTRDTLPTLLKASEIFACLPDAANLPGYPGKACD